MLYGMNMMGGRELSRRWRRGIIVKTRIMVDWIECTTPLHTFYIYAIRGRIGVQVIKDNLWATNPVMVRVNWFDGSVYIHTLHYIEAGCWIFILWENIFNKQLHYADTRD